MPAMRLSPHRVVAEAEVAVGPDLADLDGVAGARAGDVADQLEGAASLDPLVARLRRVESRGRDVRVCRELQKLVAQARAVDVTSQARRSSRPRVPASR